MELTKCSKEMDKENILICFSGGLTSAYMTKWMIDNMQDKYNLLVVFANTGKEREETLKFVHDCDTYFMFNTTWIEYVVNPVYRGSCSYKVVDYETASRNGEPFRDMVKKYGLPNIKLPHCTRELKTYAINSFLRDIGLSKCKRAIGIRVDEIDRVNSNHEQLGYVYPLVSINPTNLDKIIKFWDKQFFTLELKSYEGNCDLCPKKSLRKILTLVNEKPDLLDWWEQLQDEFENFIPASRKQDIKLPIRMFRENLSTREIREMAKSFKNLAKDESKISIHNRQLELFDLDSSFCTESCEAF